MHGSGSVQRSRPFIDRHRLLAAGRQARRPPPSSTIAEVEGEEEASGFRGGFRGDDRRAAAPDSLSPAD